MRLVTFQEKDARPGVLLAGGEILDLVAAWPVFGSAQAGSPPASVVDLLARWTDVFAELGSIVASAQSGVDGGDDLGAVVRAPGSVRLLAPVPRPPRLRDYLTYETHATAVGMALPPAFEQMPVCYKGNHLAVLGPDDTIPWPAYTDQLDFELEIGFYVAGGGCDLTLEEAASCIAGVSLFNDVSARDIQMVEMSMQIGPSKSKDFANPIGPCLLTMDEVDEYGIELVARVNGEEWVRGTTAARRYSFAELLAWASYGEPVVAGEFLAVGTVGGGCGLELGRWIQPGDVVELEASGVGVLRNTVGPRQTARPGAGLTSYRGAPRFELPLPADRA